MIEPGAIRRLRDPLARAEDAEAALHRFLEARPCIADGCASDRTPDDASFLAGHDHDGNEVWMRRWTCVAGHRYDEEV